MKLDLGMLKLLWSIGIVFGLVGQLIMSSSLAYAGDVFPAIDASSEQCVCEKQCCFDESDQADQEPLVPMSLTGEFANKIQVSLGASRGSAWNVPRLVDRRFRARALQDIDLGRAPVFLLCCSFLI